jgi:hypothetical protein
MGEELKEHDACRTAAQLENVGLDIANLMAENLL